MATKIILLAQDIKIGTEIVQFALASGAAIMEYGEVDSPLATKPKKKKSKVVRRDKNVELRLLASFRGVFQPNSLRGKAFEELLDENIGPFTRRAWVSYLTDQGYKPTQATTLIAGFIKQGALVEA